MLSLSQLEIDNHQLRMQLQSRTLELRDTAQKMRFYQDEVNRLKLELMKITNEAKPLPRNEHQRAIDAEERRLLKESNELLAEENTYLRRENTDLTDRLTSVKDLWQKLDGEIVNYKAEVTCL